MDPADLYTLADDVPALDRPVLVQALTGFIDAGGGSRLAREHLLRTLDSRVIATFDVDSLLDYRARRPVMVFVRDHWESYDQPQLAVHLVKDEAGVPFLLLDGPEPDVSWERFVEAVRMLSDQLGVRVTVGLNAIPMAVPHTRPIGMTAHATRPELVADYPSWVDTVQVPASVGSLLEYRLGQAGRDAVGFAVNVPHYLASTDYPAAALALIQSVSRLTGLALPEEGLRLADEAVRADVDAQIAQSVEVATVVRGLEEQYDAYSGGESRGDLMAGRTDLPTADELGAELERFLAAQPRPDGPTAG